MSSTPRGERDIAIVGMSACYAGARDVPALWRNILNKVYAVSAAGADWEDRYLDPSSTAKNRIYTSQGGWLHDLAEFDPREFGVMPGSVDGREPDHFLALKHAQGALADAGYDQRPFNHERAGIILGRGNNVNRASATLLGHGYILDQLLDIVARVRPDFSDSDLGALRDGITAQLPALTAEMLPGMIPNVTTGLVANRLDLMGPNFILDAACASVLVAVEQASRELIEGRCDLMLAGGVHAQTPPQSYMIFSIINALSRGRIAPFQKGANGTLLGEGVGIIALRRLEDAEADGDRIYAVIKSTGVASDGKAKGLFAPRKEGQIVALKRAYESGGIDPATIGLIEAHATGIALGDRTEIQSLAEVFGPRRGQLPTVAVGSVKSMISHAIPASGGASVIKTALALRHKVLPPTLCDEPDPELELEKTPFYINNQTRPWVHGGKTPRRAGVDAFGFGGINAHAILEEYVPRGRRVQVQVLHDPGESELFMLAAATPALLIERIHKVNAVSERTRAPRFAALAKACAELSTGEYRLAIVAADFDDLRKKLSQALDKLGREPEKSFKTRGGLHYGHGAAPGKVCLLFPGEGAQYSGMLSDICVHFPQARAWFDALEDGTGSERAARAPVIFPAPTAIDEETRKEIEARLYDMEYAAESVFAAGMALHAVLETVQLKADAMLGHSSGENTALTAARVRRYDNIGQIAQDVRALNRIYRALDTEGRIVEGTLLMLGGLKSAQRLALLADPGEDIIVAMDNCPNQLVLFGPPVTMHAMRETLSAEGVICQELPFGRAYHTPHFKPMADAYRDYFHPAQFGPGTTPVYSACTTEPFPHEPEAIVDCLASNWESRVRFTETIEKLYGEGFRVFVEVGPSSNLTSFVHDVLRAHHEVIAVATNSRRKSDIGMLQQALAQLFAAGIGLRPQGLFEFREIETLDLDTETVLPAVPVLKRTMPKLGWPVGLAVKPMPQSAAPPVIAAATVITPPAAAADSRLDFLKSHFELMQEFLDSQARVLGLATGASPPAMPSPPAPLPVTGEGSKHFPLLGKITEKSADRLISQRRYTLEQDLFLHDHTIGAAPSLRDASLTALPVIPFTFSMEIVAEAAAMLAGEGWIVIAIEQSRGSRWLALDDGAVSLRIVAERETALRVRVRLFLQDNKVPAGGLLVFEGVAVLATEYPAAPAPLPWSANESRAPQVHAEGELYQRGMFHGPRLQGVTRLHRWADDAIDGELRTLPTQDYFADTSAPQLQFDAALLDAAGQVAAYWLMEKFPSRPSCFPFRIANCQFYAPPLPAGARLLCRANLDAEATQLAMNCDISAADGQLLMRVSGWEDRVFTQPPRYADFRLHPQRASLSLPCEIAGLSSSLKLRRCAPFDDGFLDDGGQIWKRILGHLVLNRAERQLFQSLPPNGPRREEWLLGRIAAKEALRDWAAARGHALALADIEIVSDSLGRPRFASSALAGLELPALSISHSRGHALALLGPADAPLGMDFQRLEKLDAESLIAGGLAPGEQRFLEASGDARLRSAVALWSAREAAAKAAGLGLQGKPLDWKIISYAADDAGATANAQVEHAGLRYEVTLHLAADEVLSWCDEMNAVVVEPAA